MELVEKEAAETILRGLLFDTQVVGATWYPFAFSILFSRLTGSDDQQTAGAAGTRHGEPPHQVAITVESRWAVYPVMPDPLPAGEDDLPDSGLVQQVADLARLAGQRIVQVALGQERPHLALHFQSGALLFINGHHDTFECWTLRTDAPVPHQWLIVATPGDDLAVFPPKE